MKPTPRELIKSILVRLGVFSFTRDFAQVLRARLGIIHESDYANFSISHEKLRIADIGANTGQSLIAFRKKFPRSNIDCFEPNPACHPMLYKVRAIVGGEITIHGFGIGSTSGQIEFFTPLISNSIELLQEGSFDRDQFNTEATLQRIGLGHTLKSRFIEVRTIDSMTADFDILKLDVQGLEWDVLQGAIETIRRCKPIIFIERDERNHARISQFLAELGYRIQSGALNDLYWHPDQATERLSFVIDSTRAC